MIQEQAVKLIQDSIDTEMGITPDKYAMDASWKDIDLDSLELIQLSFKVEEEMCSRFGKTMEFSDEQLAQVKTPNDFVKLVMNG